jgi:nicotinamidase-related amidase
VDSRCSHDRVLRGPDEIVHPDHAALVVVDVQNDFAHTEGFIARLGLDMSHIQTALPRVNSAIRDARRFGVTVIYLQEIISRNTILPNFITQFGEFDDVGVREGTWGADFHPDLLSPEPGETVVRKPCYDGFEDTNLDVTLRALGVRTCVYAGFASNVCVEATARHGFVRGYYSVLLADATAAGTSGEHDACQATFRVFYGPVMSSDEVAGAWAKASPGTGAAGLEVGS